MHRSNAPNWVRKYMHAIPLSIVRIAINAIACDVWLGLTGSRRKQVAIRKLLDDSQRTAGLGILLVKGWVMYRQTSTTMKDI